MHWVAVSRFPSTARAGDLTERERGGLSTSKKYDHPIANFVGVFSDYVESGSIAG
jgi:hypothetical protein